jgi:nucleotide-binding universal stress UspA family protein
MGLFDSWISKRKTSVSPSASARLLVIPVDDSKHSLLAVEWTVDNVYRQKDTIHLVSVIPRVAGPYPAEVMLYVAEPSG